MKKANARKFRYGGAAIALTVAFIAAVILVNAVFSALSTRFGLYADMTKSGYYGISDATRDLLADVADDIEIIFCTPLDKLADNQYSAMVYTLAQAYATEFKNISIGYLNYQIETERVQKYMITAGSNIGSQSVIIACPARESYRVLAWDSFIAYNTDGERYGFNGELKFTSAILQITGDNPIVAFTTNHSEDIIGANALRELFGNAGYKVQDIDLTAQDIPEDARILVVYNPKTDFLGLGSNKNEFDKIDEFTAAYGHMMVFLSAGTPELPELYSYLYENWYIDVDSVTVTDTAHNALSGDGRIISATYATEDNLATSLTKSLRSMQSAPRAIADNSLALSIAPGGDNDSGEVFAAHILTTSDDAQTYRNGESDSRGKFGLMALAARSTYLDNEIFNNYVLVSGSSQFASNDYLNSASCANGDILYAAMTAMGKDKVPDNIEIKKFEDSSLDLTAEQANTWTMVFSAILPAIFLILGLIVFVRRKHL